MRRNNDRCPSEDSGPCQEYYDTDLQTYICDKCDINSKKFTSKSSDEEDLPEFDIFMDID